MKRIIIAGILIVVSISFCEAQQGNIQAERQRQEQQRQAEEAAKQRQAEAERERQRQAAEAEKQRVAAEAAARQAETKERERLRGMQLTLDDLFHLVNAVDVASVNTLLTSREWELEGRETGKDLGFPEYDLTMWRPKSSLPDLPQVGVGYLGSFDNCVAYVNFDEDHLRRLENDVKERGYQEIPSGRAFDRILIIGTDRAEKYYRNEHYEIGVSYNRNFIYVLNYKDIDFYRAEFARLEREEFERANQPATLHIYRPRNRNTIGGILGIVPRYDILLDNVVVGNTNSNWKTTVTVTSMGTKTAFANIEGRTADLQISFEPGGVYYLRSDISSRTVDTGRTRTTTDKNGRTSTTRITEIQHTPTLQLVDKSIGEREFEAIK